MAKTSVDVLAMVETALDEFDTVALAVSVRRAMRIANLLGDSRTALRLSFEVKGFGGHREANGDDVRRWLQETHDLHDRTGPAQTAMDEFLADRDLGNGKVVTFSLAQVEFLDANRPDTAILSGEQYGADLGFWLKWAEIVDRLRSRVYARLCAWERQLSFAAQNDNALMRSQLRVDEVLGAHAPEVLDRFTPVFRRLAEVSDATTQAEAGELLSQAVASCRRILKAVVDVVQPAEPGVKKSADGRALTDDAYRNRLFEFIKRVVGSASFSDALMTATDGLHARFGAIDKLANKGVHASVAQYEAEFCALNTYVLAGEIVRLAAVPGAELRSDLGDE